jgi:hypothetical protein
MRLDGIWSCELGNAYGWGSIGTLFLKDGRVTDGGRNHYSLGTYNVKDDDFTMHIEITQYGKKRTLFGQQNEKVSVDVDAKLGHDKVMIGHATISEHEEYAIYVRFIHRGDE